MVTTLINQLVSTLCGILVPRLMIGAFGSVLYGATTSIAQFLSYASLMESGIGRVARAALYKPLAENDHIGFSKIYHAVKYFFRTVGIVFIGYCIVLAFVYFDIADVTQLSYENTVILVLVIGLSSMVDYFFGITNMTLINADQKKYLVNIAIIITRIVNTLAIVILISLSSSLVSVKLFSSLVIIARPIFYASYVRKHYTLPKVEKKDAILQHKWNGMGQHMAYFLHTNTDVVLLTLMADLQTVSVYSVYSLVVISIKNITSSFAGGMEAELGDINAKNQLSVLRSAYRRYQCMLSVVSMTLFGTAATMIVPFVTLYTQGITDANYIQPAFALVLIMAEAINCISLPGTTLPVSANKLKETQWGAFGEAALNIVISGILIQWNPLLGVAIGTMCAEVFKSFFYMIYAEKNILATPAWKSVLRYAGSVLILLGIAAGGMHLIRMVTIDTFLDWICCAAAACVGIALIAILVNMGLYRKEFYQLARSLGRKLMRRSGHHE